MVPDELGFAPNDAGLIELETDDKLLRLKPSAAMMQS